MWYVIRDISYMICIIWCVAHHEVRAGLSLQDAAGEAHCVRVPARQLHAEAPLGGVPLQQCPLAGLTLRCR
jgi:hypothetical protein